MLAGAACRYVTLPPLSLRLISCPPPDCWLLYLLSVLHRHRFAHTYTEARVWLAELLQLADDAIPSRPLVVGVDTETAVKWGQRQADTPTSLLQLCYHARGSSKVRWEGQTTST
jgi:hypothetical protein